MTSYKHLDLASYEIRMLVINDARDDETLQCTLEYTSLLNPGPYSALSYRWGEATNTKQIILNDSLVEVTANLEAALKQLQSHGHKRIWADALCINQTDLEERGLQVRNMQLIYSKAQTVVAWIGNDEENIATAVAYLLKTKAFQWLPARRRTACSLPSNREIRQTQLVFGVHSSIADQWTQQRWRIFGDFFDLVYWKRVWIIQELASSSEIKVIFGKTEVSWKSILSAVTYLGDHSKEVPGNCQSYEIAAQLHHFRCIFLSNNQTPITLNEALQWSHYAQATDPRDKIYALLGLTSDGFKIIPMPNYKQPLEQIHENMTKAMFVMERSLESICMRGLGCHEDSQPSWVSDWAYFWSSPRTIQEERIFRRKISYPSIPFFQTMESGILEIEGNNVGAVCALSSSLSPIKEAGARSSRRIEPDEIDRLLPTLLQSLRNNYPSGIVTALSETLCLNHTGSADNGGNEGLNFCTPQDCFYNLWHPECRKSLQGLPLLQWLDENASLKIGSLNLLEWTQSQSRTSRLKRSLNVWHPSYHDLDQQRYIAAMTEVLQGSMRLMVTETGFLGLAPLRTQIGDTVHYIRGCSEPLVLRKREISVTEKRSREYQVIGGAHVQVDHTFPGASRFDIWADDHFGTGIHKIILT
ncbi:Heterokaryon incompatibility protein 6,OR allele [Lachnellula hyalina]|uniref:Heterokaryon incompatibility protein 6,OR allele n=1 Tax=Lachnellula hyalina TaxID=1316788 RepID=A0A8H8R3I9_9HELO|nr:Heterokaryon incompatibility protein 6,OR allele [Lachnellula hyalina]TVY26239.1 Heterokaryon incompatibility protein 6,OR allele [Lachnellula hyalina]